jgi:EpsI family protein
VHLYEGLAVSLFGYVLLFGCLPLFSMGAVRRSSDPAGPAPAAIPSGARRTWVELATLTAVLAVGVFQLSFRPGDVGLNDDLRRFPDRIGEWTLDTSPEATTGRFPAIDDEFVHAYPTPTGERRFASMDDELVRSYRNGAGDRVRLYIGYLRSQREGKELAGDASHALAAVASPLKVSLGSRTVELNQILRRQSRNERGMLYWYVFNGRVVHSMYVAKAYMAWDALTRRRTNGAVVMIAWERPTGLHADAAPADALAFTRALMPLLPQYLPS